MPVRQGVTYDEGLMDADENPVLTGSVPWTAEDFMATAEEMRRLRATPLDDWKLPRPRSARELRRSGPVWTVKPGNMDFQLAGFLRKRHASTPDLVPNHLFRFHVIVEFFQLHLSTLVRDGLARESGDDGFEIHPAVIEVVARLRYEDRRIDEYGNEQCTFDYLEVLSEARKLIAGTSAG